MDHNFNKFPKNQFISKRVGLFAQLTIKQRNTWIVLEHNALFAAGLVSRGFPAFQNPHFFGISILWRFCRFISILSVFRGRVRILLIGFLLPRWVFIVFIAGLAGLFRQGSLFLFVFLDVGFVISWGFLLLSSFLRLLLRFIRRRLFAFLYLFKDCDYV